MNNRGIDANANIDYGEGWGLGEIARVEKREDRANWRYDLGLWRMETHVEKREVKRSK